MSEHTVMISATVESEQTDRAADIGHGAAANMEAIYDRVDSAEVVLLEHENGEIDL